MSQEKAKNAAAPPSLWGYLRDIRVIQVVGQIVFIFLLVTVLALLWNNVFSALVEKRLLPNLDVLLGTAGFQIGERPEWYSENSSYGQAFAVGIINTLRIVSMGLVLATLLGVLMGIFLLSRNWLIKTIARVYVEILRNTPLLVQIYFWYFIVMGSLPQYQDAPGIPGEGIYVIPFRVPVYIALFFLTGWQARRVGHPNWLWAGAMCGLGTLELLMLAPAAFGGTRVDVALGGGLVVLLWMVSLFRQNHWRDFARGFVAFLLIAVVATGIFLELARIIGLLIARDFILEVQPLIFLTRRGIALPEIALTPRFGDWMAFVVPGIVLAMALWVIAGHVTETTGRPIPRGRYAFLAVGLAALIGWVLVTAEPLPAQLTIGSGETQQTVSYEDAYAEGLLTPNEALLYARQPVELVLPERGRGTFERGTVISPEYMGLLLGLVVYTSAFIAEIVRAGIQAVPYGQIEAARALGLTYTQTLTRIILPQALRIIIPPLGNQYLNLAKNSSLAQAIAFADTYAVGQIIMNQSGQSIVGFTMIFLVYITMSLIISFLMNIVNSRFQLVTR